MRRNKNLVKAASLALAMATPVTMLSTAALPVNVIQTVNAEESVPTETLVGNFFGLEFLANEGDKDSGYTIDSWAPGDTDGNLDYAGNGIYKKTFYFKTLAKDVTIANGGFKVAENGTWDVSYGSESGGNIELTVPAGTSKLTIMLNRNTGKVYYFIGDETFTAYASGANQEYSKYDTTISLIGSIREAGDNNWQAGAEGWDFTQITDHQYLYTISLNAGSYQYKCVYNHKDWYESEAGNREIQLSEAQKINIIYDSETGLLYDTINNEEYVAQVLGLEIAAKEFSVSQNANGTTKFVLPDEEGKGATLYYAKKSDVEEKGTSAFTSVDFTVNNKQSVVNDLFLGDAADDFVYYIEQDGKKLSVSTEDGTTAINGTDYNVYHKDAFEGRMVTVPGTLGGNGWTPSKDQMTYEGNGLYTYTFKDVAIGNYEYKIAIDGSWNENYGAEGIKDGANVACTVTEVQDVTVYYNDFSHRMLDSTTYKIADISLEGKGIPEGTKLTDDYLMGIYSTTVTLEPGTYDDITAVYNGKNYPFAPFTLTETKDVNFYFDPVTEIYYADASDEKVETKGITFDSKNSEYKSVFGAVATGEEVSFSIDTGLDATEVSLVIRGSKNSRLYMEKTDGAEEGLQRWTVTTSFDTIGEYDYFFTVSNGGDLVIYSDDDGYYGTGKTSDLASVNPYDIIVYQEGYETPDWMKTGVIYQIFPDRFSNGDTSNDQAQTSSRGTENYEFIDDWDILPENPEQEQLAETDEDKAAYAATGAYVGDGNWSNEIYGGDLEGISYRIPYLKSLGVSVIYINPVFSSISSHRYDTSDYSKIDPILGDLGDFEELTSLAEENGMKVVLDGVFNHVSDDSKYFDRYYKYLNDGTDAVGAYPYWAYVYDYMAENDVDQAAAETAAKEYFTENYGITDFSYTEWFVVENEYMTNGEGEVTKDSIGDRAGEPVYTYEGWWGYDSMPVIKSTNGSEYQTGNWAEEIIGTGNGDSIGEYWLEKGSDGWRLDVANEVSDETWQNFRASVKALNKDNVIIGEIWTDASKYLMGDMYDSVMNYVFRGAAIDYAMNQDATAAMNTLEKLRERYPKEAFYAMMNLVDSHDTTRILSYLDGIADSRADKSLTAAFPTYETTSDTAKQMQYSVAFLQFTYPGAPTIYYGDELGMVGADDPDDRRAMIWGKGNRDLLEWYATLSQVRNSYSALSTGDIIPLTFDDEAVAKSVIGYVRSDDKDTLVVLGNNSAEDITVTVDVDTFGMNAASVADVLGTDVTVNEDGEIEVTIPAYRGVILTDNPVTIELNDAELAIGYDSAAYAKAQAADAVRSEAKNNNGKDDDGKTDDGKTDDGKDNDQKDDTAGTGTSDDNTTGSGTSADGKSSNTGKANANKGTSDNGKGSAKTSSPKTSDVSTAQTGLIAAALAAMIGGLAFWKKKEEEKKQINKYLKNKIRQE